MPIFYSDSDRILFVHIPKTAGSSVCFWFAQNGYKVTNLLLIETDTGKAFREKLQIDKLDIEGSQVAKVSAQHADKDTWQKWGDFTQKFAITRNPYDRFRSALQYSYSRILEKYGHRHSRSSFSLHRYDFYQLVNSRPEQLAGLLDNHVLPQADFIDSSVKLYRYESNWQDQLTTDFDLNGVSPQLKLSDPQLAFSLNLKEKALVRELYAEDFRLFDYAQ